RHGRACPGHPRPSCRALPRTWMPGTSPGMTSSLKYTSLLHQRASPIGYRPERLLGGNRRNQLVIIIRIFRLLRLLHLEQIHRVDDAAVLADGDVAEQLVLALEFFH